MFALEIEFHDGISAPETILVRRTNSIIGSSEQAHVVIEGAASSACEMRLIRGIGREFRCQPVRRANQESVALPFLEGSYRGGAELKLGDITIKVTSLDLDLCTSSQETPDKAALKVLQSALSQSSPLFPAVAVHGSNPVFLSFRDDQPLLIGRSRKCGLRLDASDVSSEHARLGVEGGRVWVEDLGSTNGTLVGNNRVSGRAFVENGDTVKIGSEFVLSPVLNADDVAALSGKRDVGGQTGADAERAYPCIVSASEMIRPNRYVLPQAGELRLGRDPANDIWLNAPHISRQHLSIQWSSPDHIMLIDSSSNGTYLWGERLPKDQPVEIPAGLALLDFCSGLTAAICRSSAEEDNFLKKPTKAVPETEEVAEPEQTQVEIAAEEIITDPEPEFKPQEVMTGDYRGAQPGRKIADWDQFANTVQKDAEKKPGIFEKLAAKHSNQAQTAEQIASEVEVAVEKPAAESVFGTPLEALQSTPVGQQTVTFDRLSGILEDSDPEVFSGFTDTAAEKAPPPKKKSEYEDAEEEDLDYDYEDGDFEISTGNKVLKILLISCSLLLIGFCLMLVFGFFSNNYFY